MNTDVKQNKELLLGHLGGILLLGWFMVSRMRYLNREMENRNCEKDCRQLYVCGKKRTIEKWGLSQNIMVYKSKK